MAQHKFWLPRFRPHVENANGTSWSSSCSLCMKGMQSHTLSHNKEVHDGTVAATDGLMRRTDTRAPVWRYEPAGLPTLLHIEEALCQTSRNWRKVEL